MKLQRARKRLVKLAKQDPGRAKPNSQATAGTNFTKPRTSHFRGLCREKHKKDQESQHFHSMKRWIWKLGFSSIPSLLFLSHKFLMQTTSICICKCNSELATKLGSCGIRLGDLCDSMQKKIITFCHATGWLEPVGVSLSMLFSSNVK